MPEKLEWKTRKDRVDRKLKSLHPAWSIVKHRPELDTASLHCHAVEEYPTRNGPADCALFVKGRLLGIIEAKKVKVGPANVLEQAKRYLCPRRLRRPGQLERMPGALPVGDQRRSHPLSRYPEGQRDLLPEECKAEDEKLINAADS